MVTRFIATITVGLILTAPIAGFGEARIPEQPAPVHQFNEAIRHYTELHRRLERHLPPSRVTEHAREIFETSDAMAAAIRSARATAREGDLFTPDVAAYLRTRISEALTAHGFLPEELVAANVEEALSEAAQPTVNGRFPWMRGAAMWPCVLEALPALPEELEYRMVGRDLVLVDVHADLVVDILRDAVR